MEEEIQMNSLTFKCKNTKYFVQTCLILISFVVPLIICIILYTNNKFYPFYKGEDAISMLMIDARCQYIAYFRYYKALIEQGGSYIYIYTLSKVLGGDFLSIFTYYLASPFNFFIVFFSYENIPLFLLVISTLKICFSSLNMYLLLSLTNKKNKIGYLIFSIGYGLISYSFVYMFDVMWLDGVMNLPLVILGINYLSKDKFNFLYPLALAYALYSNWYIGSMICVFSVLYFLYMCINLVNCKSDFKLLKNYLIKFVIFSLIGGFISSFGWLTAFYHFSGTKASAGNLASFSILSLSTLFESFLENNYQSVSFICTNHNYASAFTSIITLVFFFIYFLNPSYSIKNRISTFILFLFYCLCFLITPLNDVMHGFTSPTWFPTRYAFILGFMVCYFGGMEYEKINENRLYSYLSPLIMLIIGVIILKFIPIRSGYKINNSNTEYYSISVQSLILYIICLVILFLYTLLNKVLKLKDKEITFKWLKLNINYSKILLSSITLCLIVLTCFSSYNCTNKIINTNSDQYLNYQTYLDDCKYQEDYYFLNNYDSENNYRVENTFNRKGSYNSIDNDAMFYSFNGLSHFSSSEKKNVCNYFSNKLGFFYNGFSNMYDGGSTLAINSFLGVKYIFDKLNNYSSEPRPHFLNKLDEIKEFDSSINNTKLYKNPYALNLGFTTNFVGDFVSQGEGNFNGQENRIYWYDPFEYQNKKYKDITSSIIDSNNQTKNIFSKLNYSLNLDSNTSSYSFNNIDTSTIKLDESRNFYKKEGEDYILEKPSDAFSFTFKSKGSVEIVFEIDDENIENFNYYIGLKNYDSRIKTYLDGKDLRNAEYSHKGIRSFEVCKKGKHILKLYNNSDDNIDNFYFMACIYKEDVSILKEYCEYINKYSALNLKQVNGFNQFGYEGEFLVEKENLSKNFVFTLPNEESFNIYIDGKRIKNYTKFDIFTGCDISNLAFGKHSIKIVYSDLGLNASIAVFTFGIIGYVGYAIYYFKKCKKSNFNKID